MSDDPRDVAAYDFALPERLIAQRPAEERDASRLMVLEDGRTEHRVFRDLPQLLRAGDLLVLNETRVIAARIFGTRPTGGRVELLLLRPATSDRYDPRATRWLALAKPGKKMRPGDTVAFERDGRRLGSARVVELHPGGVREVAFALDVPFETLLERAGTLPLPPYIHNDDPAVRERYQTVFARVPGSVAAPTASLHFTPELLDALAGKGIGRAYLTLDVGLGTFRPMHGTRIDDHVMHAEAYALPPEAVAAIERTTAAGGRIVAVGTTVVRALEGNALAHGGRLVAGAFATECFISPGFRFNVVDAMITNFHLPQSTLLVLVSAFAGRERILAAYREAVEREYRFFSFGDAMLLAPQ